MNLEKEAQEILQKLFRERVIREHDLSRTELILFYKKVGPLISLGMVSQNIEINSDNPPEREHHYLLTEKGEKYCEGNFNFY
ncbi:MAG: hypothetical protein AABX99_01280 [Nanoarchaeota archaeon]